MIQYSKDPYWQKLIDSKGDCIVCKYLDETKKPCWRCALK